MAEIITNKIKVKYNEIIVQNDYKPDFDSKATLFYNLMKDGYTLSQWRKTRKALKQFNQDNLFYSLDTIVKTLSQEAEQKRSGRVLRHNRVEIAKSLFPIAPFEQILGIISQPYVGQFQTKKSIIVGEPISTSNMTIRVSDCPYCFTGVCYAFILSKKDNGYRPPNSGNGNSFVPSIKKELERLLPRKQNSFTLKDNHG